MEKLMDKNVTFIVTILRVMGFVICGIAFVFTQHENRVAMAQFIVVYAPFVLILIPFEWMYPTFTRWWVSFATRVGLMTMLWIVLGNRYLDTPDTSGSMIFMICLQGIIAGVVAGVYAYCNHDPNDKVKIDLFRNYEWMFSTILYGGILVILSKTIGL